MNAHAGFAPAAVNVFPTHAVFGERERRGFGRVVGEIPGDRVIIAHDADHAFVALGLELHGVPAEAEKVLERDGRGCGCKREGGKG